MNHASKITDGSQKKLADAFADRSKFIAYRASTIFPVLVTPDNDTVIVMMNYWAIKNKLFNVCCNLRVYNESGDLVHIHHQRIDKDHIQISIKEVAALRDLKGMVEVEVISLDNMSFSFPAVVAYYKSKDNYSVVHSAGRIRNPDEPYTPAYSCETNWSCKFCEDITPFFHVYNGPKANSVGKIRAQLLGPNNQLIEEVVFDPGISSPFSSRVVLADELFEAKNIPGESFIKVTLPNAESFPRMVVGNFHRPTNFLEATHSFKEVDFEDYCPDMKPGKSLLSFMSIMQPEELDAEMVSFPTNSPSRAHVTAHVRKANDAILERTGEVLSWDAGSKADGIFVYRPNPLDKGVSLDFSEGRVPSRLNASYRFRVRNSSGKFSTDIASGATSSVYPAKHSHWGHGIISADYETVVMLQNISHNPGATRIAKGKLTIYSDKFSAMSCDVEIKPEGVCFIYLKQAFGLGSSFKDGDFISWFANFDVPSVYCYWVSYTRDGRICGEHAF